LYRLTNKLTTKGSEQLQNITYTYDAVGNILTLTDASNHNGARTAVYQYDDLYRLTKATVTNAANGQNYVRDFSYDVIGNILSKTGVGNYTYAGTGYANPHAVTGAGGKTYTYDESGNLLSDGNWNHTWDYKNRLMTSANGHADIQYAYDEGGERVRKQEFVSGSDTMYVSKYLEVEGMSERKHIYVGDLKVASETPVRLMPITAYLPKEADNGGVFKLDLYDQPLTKVKEIDFGIPEPVKYPYSRDLILQKEDISNQPSLNITDLNSQQLKDLILALMDGNFKLSKDKSAISIRGLGEFKIQYPKDYSSKLGRPMEIDVNLGFLKNITIRFFEVPYQVYHHEDHLSGAGVDTNSSGEAVNVFDYYPFGSVRLEEQNGLFENDFKFTGKELDSETGLYYYGARYYDAELGRFVSEDPLQFRPGELMKTFGTNPQALNFYAYVLNNPMNITDPSGECAWDACALETYGAVTVIGTIAAYIYIQLTPEPEISVNPLPQPKPVEPLTNPYYGPPAPESLTEPTGDWIQAQETYKDVWLGPITSNSLPEGKKKWVDAPLRPDQSPGKDWEWRGEGEVGSKEGAWYNPETGESLHPDFDHGEPIGPHWDYKDKGEKGKGSRVPPGGGEPEDKE